MGKISRAWVVRPYPHGKYRMQEFLEKGMVAIGWPSTGDLASKTRDEIGNILKTTYYTGASSGTLGQVTGIVNRFVNQIQEGDTIIVPDGNFIYLGTTTCTYEFRPELQADDQGYPHWVRVDWLFDKRPVVRAELPAILFDSLKGRQTVYGIPSEAIEPVIKSPDSYIAFDASVEFEYKRTYIERLSKGTVPGINSPAFEKAVMRVLRLYFPSLRQLATTNAPVGADTDLIAELPGSVVVRIQVKCFQDKSGLLKPWVVTQLRDSMESGENGIIVTTNRIGQDAREEAERDSERPIDFIDVAEFAQLVFDNQVSLTDQDLWALGLKRSIIGR
ncbi:hypothetical protein TRIP_C20317 [Candidatus Zixiibacteriota bacterium]|nr:hypothetical protein TRIP_C20317 [candidate division Zixibacteria bacterium]